MLLYAKFNLHSVYQKLLKSFFFAELFKLYKFGVAELTGGGAFV